MATQLPQEALEELQLSPAIGSGVDDAAQASSSGQSAKRIGLGGMFKKKV